MACLCGRESRRGTIGELVEQLKNLGVCASHASVTVALAEPALELEVSGWVPWRLLERGTEWILEPRSELLELLSGVRGLPAKEAKILSEQHKAVLLVVIGRRRKAGIYCDPSRELSFWRPAQSALLALGLRSHTDIPVLKELEEWFETQKEIPMIAKLEAFFERTSKLTPRRLKRGLERHNRDHEADRRTYKSVDHQEILRSKGGANDWY